MKPVGPDSVAVPVSALSGVAGVHDIVADGQGLRFTVTGPVDAAVKRLAEFPVVSLTSREPDLEDVFLDFYGEELGHVAAPAEGGPDAA